MRNKLRIPIICNYFHQVEILQNFLKDSSQKDINRIYNTYTTIMLEWNKSPDQRWGQLLSNLGLVSKDVENHIWNIEEDDWLIKNGYCNIEDVKFWGINYYKNGKKRKSTKYKLLKDLDDEHIQNIIKFFEKYNALDQLPKDYLEYFNSKINNLNK